MAQPAAYDPLTGEQLNVPEEMFAEAVAKGAVGLAPDARVDVVLADGRKGTVDATEAADVFRKGGRLYTALEQQEDAKTTAEKAVDAGEALAWGLLRGSTLGASDQFATATARQGTDFVNPFTGKTVSVSRKESIDEIGERAAARRDRLRELREIAPVAGGVGEVAGAVLPLFVGVPSPMGGVAAVGRSAEAGVSRLLAQAITQGGAKGLIAKAAARAAGGAIEGGILGAGQLITEDALGDAEFNAENLLHRVGIGALTGGVAAAGMGAAIDAAEAGVRKGLEAVKGKFGFKSVKEFLNEVEEDASLKQVLAQNKKYARRLDNQGRLEDSAAWLRKNEIVKGGDSLEDIHGKLTAKVEESGAKIRDFYDQLDSVEGARVNAKDIGERIRKDVLSKLEGKPALENIRNRIAREAEKFDELGDIRWSFREAVEQKNAYEKLSKWNASQPVEEQEAASYFREIYRVINNEIETKGDELAKASLPAGAFDGFKQAKRDFGLAKGLADAANDRLLAQQANRVVSPSDYGAGLSTTAGLLGSGAGGLMSGLGGMVTSAAHKYIRERGNTWVAEGARKLSRLSWLEGAAESGTKAVDDAVSDMIAAIRSGGSRARAAAAISSTSILEGTSFGKAAKAANTDEPLMMRLAELDALASDPVGMANKLAAGTEAFSGVAPRHAAALGAKAAKAVEFLRAKAPKNPHQPIGIAARKWTPSRDEVAKFSRYVAAVTDPLSVMRDIKDGRVSAEGAEALRSVYPRLYERVTKKLVEELAEDGDKLSYKDKIQLSTLFGVPLDETMRPSFVAAIQQAYAASAPQQGQGGGGVRLTGLDDLNQAQASMTPTQRVMARRGQ